MASDLIKKLQELIKKSTRILVIFPADFDGDMLASSLAWINFLSKCDRQLHVDIVADGIEIPKKYDFLKCLDQIQSKLNLIRDLVISIQSQDNKIGELSYETIDNKLNIYLSPQDRTIQKNDIALSLDGYNYDLIFVLGCQHLSDLDTVYTTHKDFFDKTAIINFDYHANNDNFGILNIIDVNSASLGEVIYKIMRGYNQELIDKDMATSLLAAMIAATNAFRSASTSQHTLLAASQLISFGADKRKIMEKLFESRSVAVLKLWGRVLARLKNSRDGKIAWSLISDEDILKSGLDGLNSTEQEEVVFWDIIKELYASLSQAQVVAIFRQKNNQVNVYLKSRDSKIDLLKITEDFSPQGDSQKVKLTFENGSILEIEDILTKLIETKMRS
ncbi:MAG: hypothetical protein PHS07_02770 [Patescibacteria group bacterium]|nr:hypothetical protein [Patescibacteria group bacterium]